jgi:hypothetical protein
MVDIVIGSFASYAQPAVTGDDDSARLLAKLGVIAALRFIAGMFYFLRLVYFFAARLRYGIKGEHSTAS